MEKVNQNSRKVCADFEGKLKRSSFKFLVDILSYISVILLQNLFQPFKQLENSVIPEALWFYK